MSGTNLRLIVALIGALGTLQLSHASLGLSGVSEYDETPLNSAAILHWKKLLHYKNPLRANSKSLIVNAAFFVSPTGQTDPVAEWKASLEILTAESFKQNPAATFGEIKLPFHCAFPARTRFIFEQLGPKSLDLQKQLHPCPEFANWQNELRPEKISLVFSSFYPNNPASMFGHSFLRLHRKNNESPLLDYGINFSADATDTGLFGFISILKGLFGGYKGYYGLAPYYIKLSEYHSQENRDLWEYELNLSELEVQKLLEHLWELYHSGATQYYFLDENCAYEPLKLIEAIRPDWKLSEKTGFFVSPTSTFALIYPYTRAIRYIPALKKISEYQEINTPEVLKKAQRLYIKKLTQNQAFTAADETDYSNALKEVATKKLKLNPKLYQTPSADEHPPHEAHPATQVGMGFKHQKNSALTNEATFRFRAGYHDRLNRWAAMLPGSQIRYLDFELGIHEGVRLNQATWFQIESLTPLKQNQKTVSWKAELRSSNPGRPIGGKAGIGFALSPNVHRSITGLFLTVESDLFPTQLKNLIEFVHTQVLHEKFRAELTGDLSHAWVKRITNITTNRKFQAHIGIQTALDIGKNFELRSGYQQFIQSSEFRLELRRFF